VNFAPTTSTPASGARAYLPQTEISSCTGKQPDQYTFLSCTPY
jgi:hypothetical protein